MAGEVSKLTTIERGCGDIRCEPPRLSLKDLFIISERSIMGAKITASAVCGGIAGVSAKIAVYPLDVLKKRAQIRGSETVRRHFGKVCRSVPERILEAILVNLLQFSEKRNYFFFKSNRAMDICNYWFLAQRTSGRGLASRSGSQPLFLDFFYLV